MGMSTITEAEKRTIENLLRSYTVWGASAMGRGVSVAAGTFTKHNTIRVFADELEDEDQSCTIETDVKRRTATRSYS